MEDFLLFEMLSFLSEEEFRKFIQFADSPFFNSEKKAVAMLKILQKYHPNFQDAKALSSEKLTKKLGLTAETSFRNLRSKTLKLYWDFLVQLSLEQHGNTSKLLLLDDLLKRKMSGVFQKKLLEFSDKLQPDDHLHRSRFLLDDYRLQGLLQGWESEMVFQKYLDSCDAYFLLNKIKIAAQLLVLQRIRKQFEAHPVFEETAFLLPFHARLIEDDATLHAWKIQYDLLYSLSKSMNFEAFFEFMRQNFREIPHNERKHLYNNANNLYIGCLNAGHYNTLEELNDFYKNLHLLYQFAIEHRLLSEEDDTIPHQRFKNVVSVACNAGDLSWAKYFLDKHLAQVEARHREDLACFCRGAIAFYGDDFTSAARNLATVSHKGNEFYYYDIATLQSRIYYEEDEWDFFEKKADTVRQKLSGTTLSEVHKNLYANFFKLLRDLFRLKLNPDRTPEDKKKLIAQIEKTNPVNQKKWLLEAVAKVKVR